MNNLLYKAISLTVLLITSYFSQNICAQTYDYGDAPISYGIASHLYSASNDLMLGSFVDYEGSFVSDYSGSADDNNNTGSDDDEDAIVAFPELSVNFKSYAVYARVTNLSGSPATLYGYIDFNRDGDFSDAGEQSVAVTVPNGTTVATPVPVNWVALGDGSVGSTFIRFRLSSYAFEVDNPSGYASAGETEDYPISIIASFLPVELVDFKGSIRDDKSISLKWTTASENNNNYFEIQRKSNDLSGWNTVGKLTGAGNSQRSITYSFVDKNPQKGENYYRLNQVDYNGKSTYSSILYIKYEETTGGKEEFYQFYPNPFKNTIWIKTEDINLTNFNNAVPVDIYSISGDKIYSTLLRDTQQELNLEAIQKGMYIVRIGNNKIYRIFKE